MNNAVAKTSNDKGEMVTGAYKPIFDTFLQGAQDRAANGDATAYQTPEQVAAIILDLAKEENPPLRKRISDWAEQLCHLKTKADPTGNKLLQEVKAQFL
ncbi:hypothetical protein [Croceivirga sp. JEA036]|uniref:hypothetical protein n=1 Tax=Croceivirga sp. JEA036 TaxID=2721162 RepID=UPI00143A764D|nr:hypothetical protein [Croceivirga sp. JEA036]NJB37684.1 hypothetical protein [Croceivirga sp. JEA036]